MEGRNLFILIFAINWTLSIFLHFIYALDVIEMDVKLMLLTIIVMLMIIVILMIMVLIIIVIIMIIIIVMIIVIQMDQTHNSK